MKIKRKNFITSSFIFTTLLCLVSTLSCQESSKITSSSESPESQAKAIIEEAGLKGGLIVHLNCGEGKLTDALRLNDSYLVQGLDTEHSNVRNAREYIMSKNNYGPVSINLLTDSDLPYNDNFINMIVADDLGQISKNEAMRVLTPNGVLLTKKTQSGILRENQCQRKWMNGTSTCTIPKATWFQKMR